MKKILKLSLPAVVWIIACANTAAQEMDNPAFNPLQALETESFRTLESADNLPVKVLTFYQNHNCSVVGLENRQPRASWVESFLSRPENIHHIPARTLKLAIKSKEHIIVLFDYQGYDCHWYNLDMFASDGQICFSGAFFYPSELALGIRELKKALTGNNLLSFLPQANFVQSDLWQLNRGVAIEQNNNLNFQVIKKNIWLSPPIILVVDYRLYPLPTQARLDQLFSKAFSISVSKHLENGRERDLCHISDIRKRRALMKALVIAEDPKSYTEHFVGEKFLSLKLFNRNNTQFATFDILQGNILRFEHWEFDAKLIFPAELRKVLKHTCDDLQSSV